VTRSKTFLTGPPLQTFLILISALSHVTLSVAPPRRRGDKGKPEIENSPVWWRRITQSPALSVHQQQWEIDPLISHDSQTVLKHYLTDAKESDRCGAGHIPKFHTESGRSSARDEDYCIARTCCGAVVH
jgi:hypothetical protein